MKSSTLILFALVMGPMAVFAQKGGYPAPARAALAPVVQGRKAPPQPVQQVQQKYEEEEDESALLAHRPTRKPTPPPAPAPPAPRPVYQPPPPAPAPRPVYQPPPQVAAPVRPRPPAPAPVEEGHPAPEPYSFSYAVNDEQSGAQLQREESQDANGNVVGFYHITDAEGRLRRVDYTAGPDGFQAKIQSNEEGLAARDSADAIYNVQPVSEEKQNAAAAKAQAAARAGGSRAGGVGAAGAYAAVAGNRY